MWIPKDVVFIWGPALIKGNMVPLKYQVKPHSSPCFLAACAAALVHRNHFVGFYQENKSSETKVKLWQASNQCKRVLEAAKLIYAKKTKEVTTS